MKLISAIQLNNFLSFPKDSEEFELKDLNILIGTNGSGKSNFLDAIAILRSLAVGDTINVFSRGGGIQQWIFNRKLESKVILKSILNLRNQFPNLITHTFEFEVQGRLLNVVDEIIENVEPNPRKTTSYFYYKFNHKNPIVNIKNSGERKLSRESIDIDASILSQRKDPESYPEISKISEVYSKIRMYRNWEFGRNSILRIPQQSDLRNLFLEEDFSNFFIFLNRLFRMPLLKKSIIEYLRDLNENISDIHIDIEGQTTQLFITESDIPYSSARLSDGTLRYLVLLAILLDPEPPPIICIEEPEIGLHPDLINKLATLLVDASNRTQLIVTTHSEILIDSLKDHLESVVVCEKHNGQTILKRLDANQLQDWLVHYSLGQLWLRGELGGVRW
jgi:predicted ATPase